MAVRGSSLQPSRPIPAGKASAAETDWRIVDTPVIEIHDVRHAHIRPEHVHLLLSVAPHLTPSRHAGN
jgi:hypothetical protein